MTEDERRAHWHARCDQIATQAVLYTAALWGRSMPSLSDARAKIAIARILLDIGPTDPAEDRHSPGMSTSTSAPASTLAAIEAALGLAPSPAPAPPKEPSPENGQGAPLDGVSPGGPSGAAQPGEPAGGHAPRRIRPPAPIRADVEPRP